MERPRISWTQPGTWVWISLFAVLMLTGVVMIVLALGKRPCGSKDRRDEQMVLLKVAR